jgi:hypothetical protein
LQGRQGRYVDGGSREITGKTDKQYQEKQSWKVSFLHPASNEKSYTPQIRRINRVVS